MATRVVLVFVLVSGFLVGDMEASPPATALSPPYVTILFSRSQWAQQDGCVIPAGAVTLDAIATDLAARGWKGTSSVVISRIGTTATRCLRHSVYPTWTTLRDLQARFGWRFTSHSATYPDMTKLTRERQIAESCGTIATLEGHGLVGGWGMFSYPNNRRSLQIQSEVVSRCFAFARRYNWVRNTPANVRYPWWANVWTVNGGACNDPTATCYAIATRFRYANPVSLQAHVTVVAGQWAVVQFHRLVTGSRLSGATRWDCTSTDWRRHWATDTEVYCWADYQRVLSRIPTDAVVTDPATVARVWDSNPAVLAQH